MNQYLNDNFTHLWIISAEKSVGWHIGGASNKKLYKVSQVKTSYRSMTRMAKIVLLIRRPQKNIGIKEDVREALEENYDNE